jgi:hypothetical protein
MRLIIEGPSAIAAWHSGWDIAFTLNLLLSSIGKHSAHFANAMHRNRQYSHASGI